MTQAGQFWRKVARTPLEARTRQVFAFNWGVAGVGFAMVGWQGVSGGGRLSFGKMVSRATGITEPSYEYFGPAKEAAEIQKQMMGAARERGAVVTDVVEIVKPQLEGPDWGTTNTDMFERKEGDMGRAVDMERDVAAVADALRSRISKEEALTANGLAAETGLTLSRVRYIMSRARDRVPFTVASNVPAGYWNADGEDEVGADLAEGSDGDATDGETGRVIAAGGGEAIRRLAESGAARIASVFDKKTGRLVSADLVPVDVDHSPAEGLAAPRAPVDGDHSPAEGLAALKAFVDGAFVLRIGINGSTRPPLEIPISAAQAARVLEVLGEEG